MLTLEPTECRVLGVLIEKALTTPGQYPLTLNGIVSGCNQKSNREPVLNLSEEQAFDALGGLRGKSLVREVMLSGSRVEKYRHVAKDVIETDTAGLAILAELMLRGPQTAGELRSRASRMHPLESLPAVEEALRHLMQRDEPLVRELPPAPGSRARRYAQLLCPALHPLDAPAAGQGGAPAAAPSPGDPALAERIERIEAELAALRSAIQDLAAQMGADDPLASHGQ